MPEIRSISAVTLATRDMARAVRFYEALGFSIAYGGETGAFTSFRVGKGYLNLARADDQPPSTGRVRVIFYVDDVDAMLVREDPYVELRRDLDSRARWRQSAPSRVVRHGHDQPRAV